jgi:putative ABC transport system permease protein
LINTDVDGRLIGVGLKTWLAWTWATCWRDAERQRTPVEWRIVVSTVRPADNGQMAVISLRSLRAIDRMVEPDMYFLRLSPTVNLDALRAYLKSRAGDSLGLAVVDAQVSSLQQFRLTMLALSAALSVIAVISVFNSAVLTMRERMSEVGTFKTLGMTPAQVVVMVLTSGGLIGGLAAVLGVPLGVVLLQAALNVLGKSYGFGSFELRPDWIALSLPALITVGVGLLGSASPRWAARLMWFRCCNTSDGFTVQ